VSGAVFLDKPRGLTSFSAANAVRRKLGEKRAGHTGTLDPAATGVLVVMLGGATRFIDYLPVKDKAYLARIKLGVTTDTLDLEGEVLTRSEPDVSRGELETALKKFTGDIMQVPPMYSALKKDGRKLYELARSGVEVKREARPVTVKRLELVDFEPGSDFFTVEVECSAGTYVRSLADDIGRFLGCGAALAELRRTKANGVDVGLCTELDSLTASDVKSIDSLLDYPGVTVSPAQSRRFACGGELDTDRIKDITGCGLFKVFSPEGSFLGLGRVEENSGRMTVEKVFVDV
jgi:tRNA pseudouridine55 synthase